MGKCVKCNRIADDIRSGFYCPECFTTDTPEPNEVVSKLHEKLGRPAFDPHAVWGEPVIEDEDERKDHYRKYSPFGSGKRRGKLSNE